MLHSAALLRGALATVVAAGCIVAVSASPARGQAHIEYTYEVRGLHNSSSLVTFAAQAAQTYADPRGWNLGGSITFRRVSSGADYTLWLAAAADVPSFGPPCDTGFSCRSGRNVVVNETRWLEATESWTAANRTLRDYRHLVINHETGHWLGFGHSYCGGVGQAAPVMQQQSISLQGCKPNPWPLASERTALSRLKGVPILHPPPTGGPTTTSVPRTLQAHGCGRSVNFSCTFVVVGP